MLAPENMQCVWMDSWKVLPLNWFCRFSFRACFGFGLEFSFPQSILDTNNTLLLMGCHGIVIQNFKALVATQLCRTVVGDSGIKKRFNARFSDWVAGKFPAPWQWQFLRGAWKKLTRRFCSSPSDCSRTIFNDLIFSCDGWLGRKDFPGIWPLLVAYKLTL